MENLLLHALSSGARSRLDCSEVELKSGQTLRSADEAPAHVYFPTTAIVSVVATMSTGQSVEVATVGREGSVGRLGHWDEIVAIGGRAMRASTAAVDELVATDSGARTVFDLFAGARLAQVIQIAACNRLHVIGARLPRWLLSLIDRSNTSTLKISQRHAAAMLGVHRPTVAAELMRLHKSKAIAYRGRQLTIIDRALLETLSCECHAALHQEHQRLCAALTDPLRPGDGVSRQEQAAEAFSHELRSRLHAILGWCELAGDTATSAQAIAVIRRNAQAQLGALGELLDVTAGHSR